MDGVHVAAHHRHSERRGHCHCCRRRRCSVVELRRRPSRQALDPTDTRSNQHGRHQHAPESERPRGRGARGWWPWKAEADQAGDLGPNRSLQGRSARQARPRTPQCRRRCRRCCHGGGCGDSVHGDGWCGRCSRFSPWARFRRSPRTGGVHRCGSTVREREVRLCDTAEKSQVRLLWTDWGRDLWRRAAVWALWRWGQGGLCPPHVCHLGARRG
mmetsp:Transcript_16162/g.47759  ORF Transcript_16162/g.47759 Transcript_16162/m.47759 type:complete len:214 (+) Transcript_16162:664-1305(+)